MSSSSSLARSFVWLTIGEILFNISGYVVHSGAGRLLSPSDYGRYALIITLTVMIIDLVGNGIPISMSKYLSEYYDSDADMVRVIKYKGFVLQVVIIALITGIFYAITPLLSFALGDLTLTPLFRISLFILPAYAMDTYYYYYYTGIHQFNLQSLFKVARSILRITVIIAFIFIWGLPGAVAGYIVVNLCGFLISWITDQIHISKTFPARDISKSKPVFEWKKMLNYAWPITLFIIFYEILISLDLYFIKGILHNDYLTGIYNSSLTIARIPYYLFAALNVILLPSVSKSMARKEHEKTRNLVSQSLRLLIVILLPLVTLMAVYAGPTISFVFGAKYLSGIASLRILVFGIGFLTVFYVLSFALNGAGKVKIPMWMAFFGMILNAILNYVFINRYGILGSAIATTTTSLVFMLISLSYCSRYFGKIINFASLGKMIFATALMFAASYFFPPRNFYFLIWSIILVVIYILVLFFLKEISTEDMELLKSLVSRKKTASVSAEAVLENPEIIS
jgi:O-antigen/teichoic acid export membrane protein